MNLTCPYCGKEGGTHSIECEAFHKDRNIPLTQLLEPPQHPAHTASYCTHRAPLRCWQYTSSVLVVPLWVAPYLEVHHGTGIEFISQREDTCPVSENDWIVEVCDDVVEIFGHDDFIKEFRPL